MSILAVEENWDNLRPFLQEDEFLPEEPIYKPVPTGAEIVFIDPKRYDITYAILDEVAALPVSGDGFWLDRDVCLKYLNSGDTEHHALIAMQNGAVVGAALGTILEESLEIDYLCVHDDWRERKDKPRVGTNLMLRMFNRALYELGRARVTLEYNPGRICQKRGVEKYNCKLRDGFYTMLWKRFGIPASRDVDELYDENRRIAHMTYYLWTDEFEFNLERAIAQIPSTGSTGASKTEDPSSR